MNLQQGLRNGSMEARSRFTLRNIFNRQFPSDYMQEQVKKNAAPFDASIATRHRQLLAINRKLVE